MHRLPRVSPDVPLVYKNWIIPRGVRQTSHRKPQYSNIDFMGRYLSGCIATSCTPIRKSIQIPTNSARIDGSETSTPAWINTWYLSPKDPAIAWANSKSCFLAWVVGFFHIAKTSFFFFFFSLAAREIRMVLACLFRPGGPALELFETDDSDIFPVHDFVAGFPKLDSKGLRVLIR